MAIIQGNAVSAGGFYPKEIEQSLRLNDDDSAYLSRTPSVAGNRKTWTFSTWVKRGNLGSSNNRVFGVHDGSPSTDEDYFTVGFNNSDQIFISGWLTNYRITTAVYRDTSSWYHVVVVADTSNTTANDRLRLYVNGVRVTSFSTTATVALDKTLAVNTTTAHYIGTIPSVYFDAYLAETHFIDGTAYTASDFGEFKNGVWIPKANVDTTVTYGTNGFYLPYNNDYTVEGFSATTYKGTGSTQYIGGVGFEPDLVWIKDRGAVTFHTVHDSVRGADKTISPNSTTVESTTSNQVVSFETDGVVVGNSTETGTSGNNYVAWCWDAGTGSPASNTDGTITSTVKASTDYGFSIVSYTGTGSAATVGHGLSSAPEMVIWKNRTDGAADRGWHVQGTIIGDSTAGDHLTLHTTNQLLTSTDYNTTFGASTISLDIGAAYNDASDSIIAYCFHSVSGYSDFGSYSGTGASGNTVTTGFRPAFVMVKRNNSTGDWFMYDSTRSPINTIDVALLAQSSGAEIGPDAISYGIDFTDTGFTLQNGLAALNASGGTYIYMAFADTREAAFWLDQSGNNNDWENNGLTESDISLDSPTNNFATLNPLRDRGTVLYQEGNLEADIDNITATSATGTMAVSSGKWYWETLITDCVISTAAVALVGAIKTTVAEASLSASGTDAVAWYGNNGFSYSDGVATNMGATFTKGDIVGIGFDLDTLTISYYKNGTFINTDTIPSAGDWQPIFHNNSTGTPNFIANANFGQDSSFAGNKVAQGNTDANGIGDFYYAPPAGYLALCTANLPEPAIGPNSATTSDEHFNTVLYTGDGASQSITGVGFQPDLLWLKQRNSTGNHRVFDAIRTAGEYLVTAATDAEATTTIMSSFDSDGFSFTGTGGPYNASASTYVAWNWKADNTSGSSNTDGTITSTVAANVDAGFSIVGYTGNGVNGATVGHGLSQAPDMYIVKSRDVTSGGLTNWRIYHKDLGATKNLLFTTSAELTATNIWNDTAPTSSAFSVGTHVSVNDNTYNYIALCFHSVEGYSKFGSYTGNGSADGPMIFLGFRPSFVIMKRTDVANDWVMWDVQRDTYNAMDTPLKANTPDADQTGWSNTFDILSNGFKFRASYATVNASGGTYIYMAFAENGGPFKYSNAR